ncbi:MULTISPECIES: histidine-histamine antiporter [Vibrio]|uniref:histidine-histamine antiporter n=1 Tax=Vibrio TaxID=662 RepID=UPI000C164B19|nr:MULTISPECIES: histidine-histamine antiporter [Vibrio]NAW68124.1 histidine-histamine antiporter [Vibrio sp. V28_P6S34P95]NAX04054.1 histidine-histamine antiporter [Vibrio sp. V30_P3S12P165]NNN45565.1 histidine-histamine antiporter [Vibrio sp. 1-1(7)]NNN73394.1 histidine-histamine antiporter [Vibrio sp. 12-2(3-a)]
METVSASSAHKMGVVALTLVTASNMMGSGVFMLPTNLAGVGYISLWGWLFTIIGVIAIALVFAKTSLLTPRNGGIVAYASDAFGPFIGFQTTVCYWISAWVGNVALLVAGVGYLSYFFPELTNPSFGCIAAIAILWGFVLLASFGARVAGRAQSFTASCMLLVVLGVGVIGWFWFDPHMFTQVYNGTGKSDSSAIMAAASIALWGFLGVESAVVSSGQVKDPERTVPKATVYGLLIASVCYVGSCSVIMGLVPHEELIHSAAPFADAARYMFGETAGNIASALSIIACFGSISGWLILQSEGPRAGAAQGLFPQFFADVNKNDVPMKSLIFTGVLMSIVLMMTASPNLAKQFEIIILMSVFASLLPYMYALISLPIIMVSKKLNRGRTFMFYSVMVVLGMVYSIFALLGSGSDSIFWGIVMMMITIPMFSFVAAGKSNKGEKVLYLK